MMKIKRIISLMLSLMLFAGMLMIPADAAKAGIKLNSSAVTLAKGKSYTLKPTVTGISQYTVEWSTSNKNVCTVDTKGYIYGVKNGSAVITAKVRGRDLSAKCKVTVVTKVSSLKIRENKITLEKGKTYTVRVSVSPETASDKTLVYTSSDDSVASVSAEGVITGLKAGNVTITAKAADGSKKTAELKVTVLEEIKTPPPALSNFDTKITAASLVRNMKTGMNLGNSLDAHDGSGIKNSGLGSEIAWGNPKLSKNLIDALKAKGFKTVRIPVTWHNHVDGNYNIDAKWMARVKEVVDYAINDDMYVILNMHHDNTIYNLQTAMISAREYEKIEKNFLKIWSQIGAAFSGYDEHLIFEAMNEPRTEGSVSEWNGGTSAERKIVNDLNAAFVKEIRSLGGNNPYRFLMLSGYAASSSADALSEIVFPEGDSRLILSVHAYIPYNFAMQRYSSGMFNKSDENEINDFMKLLNEKFISKDIPVVISEMGATNKDNLTDRETWARHYVTTARRYGIACVWWDNGKRDIGEENFGIIDRKTAEFYFGGIADALTS